ncbi:MAG: hypothetical protein R3F59_08870 [Myxococcota bacterium]
MSMSMRAVWLLVLAGCANLGPGEACEATGDGFTRRDPCETTCIGWSVACADGTSAVPAVCAGDACEADADCPAGWGCAATDSFARACLPASSACGGAFAP